MIFDSSRLGKTIAYMIQTYPIDTSNRTVPASAYHCRILVGSGTQPTPAQLESNWSTEYFYNYATTTVGNSILCGYGDLWDTDSANDVVWELPLVDELPSSNILYLANTIPQSYYFKDGTATFAVIWFNEDLRTTSASFPNDNCIIVPVSDITGNGIVKLETVNVANTAPELSSMNLDFSGGA